MKRSITAGIVLFLLICMVSASASTAGTSSDPLITLDYLRGSFSTTLITDISQTLRDAADIIADEFDESYANRAGYSYGPRFTQISFASGERVTLLSGGSFILLSGSAALSVSAGGVINISTGGEAASGTRLELNQRYFCLEDTTAIISASAASTGQIDGFYRIEPALSTSMHPVFNDVAGIAWYYTAVDYVYSGGLFGGTSPGTFSPAVLMTRGMFVTVLHRLEGSPPASAGAGADDQFSDINDSEQYYFQAVAWANEMKIAGGYSDGTFRPNDSITREQIAAMMYRYAEYSSLDITAVSPLYNTFPDVGDVSGYAADAMRWAVSKGLINGSDGMLLPQQPATRAQVAQIIFNYVNAYEG